MATFFYQIVNYFQKNALNNKSAANFDLPLIWSLLAFLTFRPWTVGDKGICDIHRGERVFVQFLIAQEVPEKKDNITEANPVIN